MVSGTSRQWNVSQHTNTTEDTCKAASALGVKDEIPTISTNVGGQAAEKISFIIKNRKFIAFVVFHGGYVYFIGVTTTGTETENLSKHAENLANSILFPNLEKKPNTIQKVSSIADLGLTFTGKPNLIISPIKGQNAISILEPTKKVGLIITRSKKDEENLTLNKEKLKLIYHNKGYEVRKVNSFSIDGENGWELHCFQDSPNGDQNYFLLHIVERNNFVYLFNAVTDAKREKELIAFAKNTLNEIKFLDKNQSDKNQ